MKFVLGVLIMWIAVEGWLAIAEYSMPSAIVLLFVVPVLGAGYIAQKLDQSKEEQK